MRKWFPAPIIYSQHFLDLALLVAAVQTQWDRISVWFWISFPWWLNVFSPMHLLDICNYLFEKYLFISFSHVLVSLFFWCLIFKSLSCSGCLCSGRWIAVRISPFFRLPFHSVHRFLCRAETNKLEAVASSRLAITADNPSPIQEWWPMRVYWSVFLM